MRYGRRLAIALMLELTPSAALAQTARTCMSAVEAEALIQYALPDVITHVGTTCAAVLPASAYLVRHGGDLAARYRKAAAPAFPAARAAFGKMTGIKAEQVATLRDESLRGLLDLGIGAAVDGKFKPTDCGMIDRVVKLIAPLPPENIAKLIGIAVREGDKPKKDDSGKPSLLRLCDGEKGV